MHTYEEACKELLSSPVPREGLVLPRVLVWRMAATPDKHDDDLYAALVRDSGSLPSYVDRLR